MSTTWKSLCALAFGLILTSSAVAADHPRTADSKAHGQDYQFWVHNQQPRVRQYRGPVVTRPVTPATQPILQTLRTPAVQG